MKKKGHKDFKYRIELNWSPEDQVFIARVPELEGCITHGETYEEALSIAEEAIVAYLESRI